MSRDIKLIKLHTISYTGGETQQRCWWDGQGLSSYMYSRITCQQTISHSANASPQKWALARDGTKFTSVCRDLLYTNLYGSCTLAYWARKDDIPTDSKQILWEESQLPMKRTSRSQRQIDTKTLSNQCGFAQTNFDRKLQDTHTGPVCNAPKEDWNNMFTCKGPTAVKNRE